MKANNKRIIALLLVVSILISQGIYANASDDLYTLNGCTVELDGTSDVYATVTFTAKTDVELLTVQANGQAGTGSIAYNERGRDSADHANAYFTAESVSLHQNLKNPTTVKVYGPDDRFDYGSVSVLWVDGARKSVPAGEAIMTVTYRVDKDTPANTYYIDLNDMKIHLADEENGYIADYAAAITVVKREPVASGFEVFYKLADGVVDEGQDGWADGNPNGTVDFDVYVKNTTEQDATLQAFDIYPVADSMLTLAGVTDHTGKGVQNLETHIQSIAKDLSVEIPAGEEAKILTLTYTIGENAIYGERYDVYFTEDTVLAIGDTPDDVMKDSGIIDTNGGQIGAETLTKVLLKFHANGGTGSMADQEVQYNKATPIKANEFTRKGYSFRGWATTAKDYTSEADIVYNVGASVTAKAQIDLYALWEPSEVSYTVRHYKQNVDGTYPQEATETETFNALVGESVTPAVKQYEHFTAPATQTVVVDPDGNTLVEYRYAREVYKVNFITDHGTVPPAQYVVFEGRVTSPGILAETGYTFEGWYTDDTYATAWDFDTMTISAPTTIYAKWSSKPVTVILDLNYTGASTSNVTESFGAKYANLTTPTRDGYNFVGWFDAAEEGNQVQNGVDTVNSEGPITLYAHWTAKDYTVKFDINGGTLEEGSTAPADIIATFDTEVILPDSTGMGHTFSKQGFKFLGWSKDPDAKTASYVAGTPYTNLLSAEELNSKTEVTLYAVWTEGQYTITYKFDNGEADLVVPYDFGDTIEPLTEPTKTGYTFTGWSPEVPATMPADSLVVTAQYRINTYTITFDTQGGTSIEPITLNFGEAVTAPADPTKTGYTFTGWDKTIPATMPAEDMTITASWQINQYTITFKFGNGNADQVDTYNYGATVIAPADPTRDGYSFVNWDKEIPATMPAENVEINALWNANAVLVTLDPNYDNQNKTTISVLFGGLYEGLESLTRYGYNFDGWFTASVGGTQVTAETTVTNYNPHTLYAHWTPVTVEVTLNPVYVDGDKTLTGTLPEGITNPISVTFGETYPALPEPTPPGGYEFDGWYIGPQKIVEGQDVTIGEANEAVAHYKIVKYTITLDYMDNVTSNGSIEYHVTDSVELPNPTRDFYNFDGWYVMESAGNWGEVDAKYSEGKQDPGKHGNVKLYAKWVTNFPHAVTEYKYAQGLDTSRYVLLRIADNLEAGKVYTFNVEGITMYYTDAEGYKLDEEDKGTFLTLIPVEYMDLANFKLNDAGVAKLKIEDGTCQKVAYSGEVEGKIAGDINGDGAVNVADANAVYQMLMQANAGGYYSTTQLDTLHRLMADMVHDASDSHASIEDVKAIVDLINGN